MRVRAKVSIASAVAPDGKLVLVANLLPKGVGKAVKDNPCPKIFIPNTGVDPESFGLTAAEQVIRLLEYLKRDAVPDADTARVLNFVLADRARGDYPGGLGQGQLKKLGVGLLDCPLVTDESAPFLDEELVVPLLLSLA